MRKRYSELLGPDYSPNKVYVRSTGTQRTIESAKYNSAGIFAPPSVEWQDALQYQSVPVNTVPLFQDYVLGQFLPCSKMDLQRAEYVPTIDIDAKIDSCTLLRTYLEEHSGSPVNTVDDFYMFFDSLNLENMSGLP